VGSLFFICVNDEVAPCLWRRLVASVGGDDVVRPTVDAKIGRCSLTLSN